MRKGESTKAKILDAATDQASVRGLAAVSLNDVADAVGLSKSGVFKHFEAKETLHMALLESMIERFVQTVWEPAKPRPHGRPRLEKILDGWLRWVGGEVWTGGCPIMATVIELDDQPGPLRDFLKEGTERWGRTVRAEFKALREPPLTDEEADQAAFEFKGIVLSFNESKRMFGDEQARQKAERAFAALADRLTAAG